VTRAFLIILFCLLATACGSPQPAKTGAPVKVRPTMLTVTSSGGLCPQGACGSELTIRSDGRWTLREGAHANSGRIDQAQTVKLARQIAHARRDELVSGPFTGTCPTVYDGEQTVWKLYRTDRMIVLDSCADEFRTDARLFMVVESVARMQWNKTSCGQRERACVN
jgi:hypothetical protein